MKAIPLDPQTIVTITVALITAASGYFAARYKFQSTKTESDNNVEVAEIKRDETLLQTIIRDHNENCEALAALRLTCKQLTKRVAELEAELAFYRENTLAIDAYKMLEAVMHEFDGPAWIHVVGESKWYLNDHYCKFFSVRRKSFWTPINIFAHYKPDRAAQYVEHDMRVAEAGASQQFEETCNKRIMDPSCTESMVGLFRKTPIRIGEKAFVIGRLLNVIESTVQDDPATGTN